MTFQAYLHGGSPVCKRHPRYSIALLGSVGSVEQRAQPGVQGTDSFRPVRELGKTRCKSIGKVFLMTAASRTSLNLSAGYYLGALLGCLFYFLI